MNYGMCVCARARNWFPVIACDSRIVLDLTNGVASCAARSENSLLILFWCWFVFATKEWIIKAVVLVAVGVVVVHP